MIQFFQIWVILSQNCPLYIVVVVPRASRSYIFFWDIRNLRFINKSVFFRLLGFLDSLPSVCLLCFFLFTPVIVKLIALKLFFFFDLSLWFFSDLWPFSSVIPDTCCGSQLALLPTPPPPSHTHAQRVSVLRNNFNVP